MPVLHMIRKEFLQLRRDHRMFPIIFIAPVIQLVILGYAANLDVKRIPSVVCDMDRTQASRDFISRFVNSGYFTMRYVVDRMEDVDDVIDKWKAAVGIIIPNGFGKRLILEGKPAQVQIITDGAESQSAVIALNYATMIIAKHNETVLAERIARSGKEIRSGKLVPEFRVWYNPELRSRNFMVPGVLALLLMVMTMMLTSLGIVKEKELGTMEQLVVTPIRPYQLILGKLLPFLALGFVDILLVLLVATFWFRVPVKGSLILLFGLGIIFMMTTLGLGLFISTISKNQQQAMMSSVFFMIPMLLLSGFVFPIENMPKIIQAVTYAIPLRYFLVIIRGLFLKGVGMNALWDETLALIFFGLFILAVSVMRFQKRIE